MVVCRFNIGMAEQRARERQGEKEREGEGEREREIERGGEREKQRMNLFQNNLGLMVDKHPGPGETEMRSTDWRSHFKKGSFPFRMARQRG